MKKLSADDLYSLEQYAKLRTDFRTQAMAHKLSRKVEIGEHATLLFEDRMTMQYQVQEILRIEKIFEPEAIAEELEAYNALIPDARNWKATLMLQYPDVEQRRNKLQHLIGVAEQLYICVAGHSPVYAIADEDLPRETEEKTSSVHFLRFEFTADMVRSIQQGSKVMAGVKHPHLTCEITLDASQQKVLAQDFGDVT